MERLRLERSFGGDVKSYLADKCYVVSCLLDRWYARQIFRSIHVRMDERRAVTPLGVLVVSTDGRAGIGDVDLSPEDGISGIASSAFSRTVAGTRCRSPHTVAFFSNASSNWSTRTTKQLEPGTVRSGVGRVLPPLKYNGKFMMVRYTILTDLDCCSNKWRWPAYSESFKVLIISVDKGQPGYNLHVLTPAEWSWSRPRKFFGTLKHGMHVAPQQATAAVCQGTAHWLFRQTSSFYTFSVCTKAAHMSVTRLPIMQNHLNLNLYSEPMLSVTNDDTLSLLHLYRKCTMLEISTCQRDNKSENGGPIAPVRRF
ncbi:hypothetical protein D1007_27966 [Hordeum vulgare]|nr:hypothetical protein D1007_27966 [Hordeum vulgare]